MAFLVPAFLAAAAIPWMDERFFVYLVPPAAVLLARAPRRRGGARAADRPLARVAVRRADADAPGRGSRTLGLAGRPPEPARHAGARRPVVRGPRPARDAGGRWRGTSRSASTSGPARHYFEPRRPLAEARRARTSSSRARSSTSRYLDPRLRFLPLLGQFFRALPQEGSLMRTFALAPLGFAHPSIAVYATRPPRVAEAPALFLPRPYDHTWNGGVAFLDPGPYDRDDRTVFLGGAQVHDVTLAGAGGRRRGRRVRRQRAAGEPGPHRGRVDEPAAHARAGGVARRPLPAALAVAGPPGPLPGDGGTPARGTERAGSDPGRGPGDRRGVRRMGTLGGRRSLPGARPGGAPRRWRAPAPASAGRIAGSAGRRTRAASGRGSRRRRPATPPPSDSSVRARAAPEAWTAGFEQPDGTRRRAAHAGPHPGGARRRAPRAGPTGR